MSVDDLSALVLGDEDLNMRRNHIGQIIKESNVAGVRNKEIKNLVNVVYDLFVNS